MYTTVYILRTNVIIAIFTPPFTSFFFFFFLRSESQMNLCTEIKTVGETKSLCSVSLHSNKRHQLKQECKQIDM